MALAALLPLAGCALPRSGPSVDDFTQASERGQIRLIEATPADAAASRARAGAFPPAWQKEPPAVNDLIGTGDFLDVAIFERDGIGLFPPGADGAARFADLPVEQNGSVQIPLIGAVNVSGLSLDEARRAILDKLKHLSASADVAVLFASRHAQLISIQGDVLKPDVVALSPETNHLLRVLALAGPTPANIGDAVVTVRRAGQSASVPLSAIYSESEDNITMRAGDIVIVQDAMAYVNVVGAAGLEGRVKIAKPGYSVLDAVGDSRGLDDNAADPASVYLLRAKPARADAGSVPRVYHFDFTEPSQIAVAAAFDVRDGDAIFISNAPFAQARKVLSIFSGVLSSARSASDIKP